MSLYCTKCKLPFNKENENPDEKQLLTSADIKSFSSSPRRIGFSLPRKVNVNNSESFVLVKAQSSASLLDSLSTRIRATTKFFEILGDSSDVDCPLCQECAEILCDILDKQLEETIEKRT
jgi:hypothetical protein